MLKSQFEPCIPSRAVVAVLCVAVVMAFLDRARMTGSLFLDLKMAR